jgi:hypothetical protein
MSVAAHTSRYRKDTRIAGEQLAMRFPRMHRGPDQADHGVT